MRVRAPFLQALQQRAGPQQRRGARLLPALVMIASAVCGAIASFPLIGLFQAGLAHHLDPAKGLEELLVRSGDRCTEQLAKRP